VAVSVNPCGGRKGASHRNIHGDRECGRRGRGGMIHSEQPDGHKVSLLGIRAHTGGVDRRDRVGEDIGAAEERPGRYVEPIVGSGR